MRYSIGDSIHAKGKATKAKVRLAIGSTDIGSSFPIFSSRLDPFSHSTSKTTVITILESLRARLRPRYLTNTQHLNIIGLWYLRFHAIKPIVWNEPEPRR